MGEVSDDAMGVAVYDLVSILIISLSATVLLGDSFGFIRWSVLILFLMLKFCTVEFFPSVCLICL